VANNEFAIKPKGVFIADSPIDLLGLYRSSEKNIEHNFSEIAVQESNWIIEYLEKNFGDPENSLSEYEKKAVFTLNCRSYLVNKYLIASLLHLLVFAKGLLFPVQNIIFSARK
jgi:hypothetical protein